MGGLGIGLEEEVLMGGKAGLKNPVEGEVEGDASEAVVGGEVIDVELAEDSAGDASGVPLSEWVYCGPVKVVVVVVATGASTLDPLRLVGALLLLRPSASSPTPNPSPSMLTERPGLEPADFGEGVKS